MTPRRTHSPFTVAVSGLAALAVAIGIGRFAFTPILPMIQAGHGISVAQGGWLASANYLGYLAGSLFAMHPDIPTRTAIRSGLVLIAACTLAMGVGHHFTAWLILRAIVSVLHTMIAVLMHPAMSCTGTVVSLAMLNTSPGRVPGPSCAY